MFNKISTVSISFTELCKSSNFTGSYYFKLYALIINGENDWRYTVGGGFTELFKYDARSFSVQKYYTLPFEIHIDKDNPISAIDKFIKFSLLK